MGKREAITALLKPGGGLELFAALAGQSSAGLVGRRLGAYEVTELIAEGGMSQVYRGRRSDDQFEREVAIKVAFSAIGPDARERFFRERDILAELDHPNIARLLDAGVTDEGWPYLVMEHIAGQPVDEFCITRGLALRQRIDVLIALVEALAHAHAHLVIHRDLKPSNVLVTEAGDVKLLDFGIAKLLSGDAGAQTSTFAMTPAYASPEQILGRPVTTASDIYQLGLLAYRVLTGRHWPEERSLEGAVQRAMGTGGAVLSREERARLPRDLATVVEHCLAVDAGDRYRTAGALASDLARFRDGYPPAISAVPWHLRVHRFVKRNAAATSVAAVSTLALLAGTVFYTVEVTRSRDAAESQAHQLNRVLEAVTQLLGESYETLIASRPDDATEDASLQNEPLRSVLTRTERLIDEMLADAPQARAELLLLQARTNRVLTDLERANRQGEQALAMARAEQNDILELRVLVELMEIQYHAFQPEPGWRYAQAALDHPALADAPPTLKAAVFIAAGEVLKGRGEYEETADHVRRAIDILENAPTPDRLKLARAYTELGEVYSLLERTAEALPWNEKAVALLIELEGPDYRELQWPYSAIGWHYHNHGDHETALEFYNKSLAIAMKNFGDNSPKTATALGNQAMALKNLGRFDEALASYTAAAENYTSRGNLDSPSLAMIYLNMGNLFADYGDYAEATTRYEEGLSIARRVPGARRMLALLLNNTGRHLADVGELQRGIDLLREARREKAALFGPDNPSTGRTIVMLARALASAGELEAARAELEAGRRIYTASYAPDSTRWGTLHEISGFLHERAGEPARAVERYQRALELRAAEHGETSVQYAETLIAIARVDHNRARALLAEAQPALAQLREQHLSRVEAALVALEAGDAEAAESPPARLETLITQHYPARVDLLARLRAVR